MSITRRRLFAASGAGLAGAGAITALSACGSEEEEPSAERDVELLNAALAAEATVAGMYEDLPATAGPDERNDVSDLVVDAEVFDAFAEQAAAQVERLTRAIEDAGGTPSEGNGSPPEAESAVEALTLALNPAIAAYHEAAGDLSTSELNRLVLELMVADAAQLAALRGILGEQQAPEPFVTGLDEPPLISTERVT
jgi:hypothetical protein